MQVGDFIALPCGDWLNNHAAKKAYLTAQQTALAYKGDGQAPQYELQSGPAPTFTHQLVRTR